MTKSYPALTLRIALAPGSAIGPGKADLLEGIEATGSIAAAGRRMGMSYRRAWTLIETLNGMFKEPLVHSTKGGRSGGGAKLTQMGKTVLSAYRAAEQAAAAGAGQYLQALEALAANHKT